MNDTESTEAPDTADEASSSQVAPARRTSSLPLIIALLALLGTGLLAWQQRSGDDQANARFTDAEIQSLKRAMEKLEGTASYNAETIQQLSARLDAQAARMDTLPIRIEQIETLLADLPGTDEEARRNILLLEAEWYLRLADAQLRVARNIPATQLALSLADERFAALAEPKYTPIRDRIGAAIGELQIRQQHPAAADANTIQTIIDRVPALKVKANLPDSFGSDSAEAADGSGTERAWNAIGDAFSSVISVKRSDAEVVPQLSNADAALIRRSLLLELQTAKLAVLQNETAIFTQSLLVVSERLQQWFEPSDTAVADSLTDIEQLLLSPGRAPLPDLAGLTDDLALLQDNAP